MGPKKPENLLKTLEGEKEYVFYRKREKIIDEEGFLRIVIKNKITRQNVPIPQFPKFEDFNIFSVLDLEEEIDENMDANESSRNTITTRKLKQKKKRKSFRKKV